MESQLFTILPERKTLIYHLGGEAGFYSEFNNLVLGILYCYKHKINFKLFSKDANFGYLKGWTDYFQPFCNEVDDSFHSKYNIRQPSSLPTGILLKTLFTSMKEYYKATFRFNYYTYELWPFFHNHEFENELFEIGNKEMDIIEASQYVINSIWRYNDDTQVMVNKLYNKVLLPDQYMGLHVRQGDKIVEHENTALDNYMKKLRQITPIKDIFVYSDSFSVVQELRKAYPQYCFYTLNDDSDKGYFHQEFMKKGVEYRKKAILKMFASVDILSKAAFTIGTFSTNIGMFLGMRMRERMIGVDYDGWSIW